jgi:hypothetical protein
MKRIKRAYPTRREKRREYIFQTSMKVLVLVMLVLAIMIYVKYSSL